MKTLFREYFYIPKDGKIKDQVMMAHVIFTTVFILLCLLAMVVTAYSHAMFNYRVEAEENVIAGASFDAHYYVERTDLDLIEPEEGVEIVEPEFVEVDDHTFEVTFDTVGTYFVTVSAQGTAQNGFCVFEITCDDPVYDAVYCTPSMSWYGGNLSEIQFYFDVTVPATVTATSYLGKLTDYEQFDDMSVILLVDGDAVAIGEPIEFPEDEELEEEGLEFIDESLGDEETVTDETHDSSDGTGDNTENQSEADLSGGDSGSDSDSTPTGSDSRGDNSSTPTGGDSGSDSASTPTGGDSGSDSASTPTGGDSGSDSGSTPTGGDSGSDSGSTSTGGDSGSDSGATSSGGDSSSGGGDSAPTGE